MTIEIRDASLVARIQKQLQATGSGSVEEVAAHDAWFRAKVHEVLNDPRPAIPHQKVEAHFARRRAAAQCKPP
jgi:DNA-damage-inducible protein J